ncbi:uncharacterized protein [Nerophis lumbriciformis]|uniref:uncharacterized protein n=1 Tax=Nerophis lumbriciformis TaxID=546530 RepID=UPI003BAD4B71
MKRGHRAFLGRKERSLFDTTVKMREMERVELVLNSPTMPESGTASVRARPTVKHHTSSEGSQGFVPTPRVPVLPPVNGPKINGAANGNVFSYDLVEEDVFVPPPPSNAPPPPPENVILPPPDFLGYYSNYAELPSLQPPPMAAPQPPVKEGKNHRVIKPTFSPPPKPLSTSPYSSVSPTSISKPSPAKVPKHPNFAPPPPPFKGPSNTVKTPPAKPIRFSSMSNLESPPHTPAPSPPVQTRTQSTFNPQNPAKLYHVSNASVLLDYKEQDKRPKQMLLLEDSGSAMLAQVDRNVPRGTPTTLVRQKNLQHVHPSQPSLKSLTTNDAYQKENVPNMLSSQSPKSQAGTPLQVQYQEPRKLQKGSRTHLTSGDLKGRVGFKPNFSPVLDHKLHLKNAESSASQEGPAASPLALLNAARERDRFKGFAFRENGTATYNERRRSIQQTDPNTESSILPRSISSSLFHQNQVQVSPMSVSPTQKWGTKSATIGHVGNQTKSSGPAYAFTQPASPVRERNRLSYVKSVRPEDDREMLGMPLLPPPPEFDDFDSMTEPPPSISPPTPEFKKAPRVNMNSPPPDHIPPKQPKHYPIYVNIQQNPFLLTKPKADPVQTPPPQSQSQTTLVSILQKKMLELDHQISPSEDADDDSEEWGIPLSENIKVPVLPKTRPQATSYFNGVTQTTTTNHKQETQDKVVRKYQATNSSGPPSSHQYGMTYRIRPGTNQPITLIRKGPS